MYAIRSYYATKSGHRWRKNIRFPKPIEARGTNTVSLSLSAEWYFSAVITSYSIHYTKLYENRGCKNRLDSDPCKNACQDDIFKQIIQIYIHINSPFQHGKGKNISPVRLSAAAKGGIHELRRKDTNRGYTCKFFRILSAFGSKPDNGYADFNRLRNNFV